MAINYNEEEFGLQIPNEGGITDVAFAPGSALDKQINKLNTLEQMGYPQQNLQNLKDMDMKQFKETGTPLSLPRDQYAMAISNYDQLFGPKTMTDSFGTSHNLAAVNRPDLYTGDLMAKTGQRLRDPFAPLENQFMGPHDPSVFGMNMPNTTFAEAMVDEDRIPGRIQESVPNYQSGWDKFTGKIGDVWSGAKDKLSNFEMPPIGIMGLLQALNRSPFDIDSPNYSKGLGLQVDDLREVGFLPQKTADGYKILGGPLAGKNLVSAFGTNDYDEMLAKKAAWFQRRKDLNKGFSQTNWNKVIAEQKARAAERRAHGERSVGERTLGGNFQIERGGSDAVNRDLARREAANRNRSRAARQDTTSMRSAGRSYTDAQGNRGYSRGRKDGGRIGYANGGLASLFTRRG